MLVLVEPEKESDILFRERAAPLHSHHSRVAWLEKLQGLQPFHQTCAIIIILLARRRGSEALFYIQKHRTRSDAKCYGVELKASVAVR